MSLIKLQDICLSFGPKLIFDHFNLKVNSGDKILITGKSGKGKSTMLKVLLGFCPIDSGTVFFDDKEMNQTLLRANRQRFGYVNQDVTLRDGPVKEILAEIAKFDHNHFQGRIDEKLMDYFEFNPELLEKKISQLSGGERQRLGLMIAIMLEREIYLLDEVTSALDSNLKAKVAHYFGDSDATVIAISHDDSFKNTGKFKEVNW